MMDTALNRVYTRPGMRRRYEVWFLKLLLADGSGAWWFRYLLLNPGRGPGGGCPGRPRGMPVQLWATWFPAGGKPETWIQGFSAAGLTLGGDGAQLLSFQGHCLAHNSCCGRLEAAGRSVSWDLQYRSTFGRTLSDVGWIGFSRTAHSDAVFSGEIRLDDRVFRGEPLGYGLQGHNCGFRHRHLWNWAHCAMHRGGELSTFEALEYEIPLGLRFRKAMLWHEGRLLVFPKLREIVRDRANLQWVVEASVPGESQATLLVVLDGSGPSAHRLPYLRTDCRSSFEVSNNSLARAVLHFKRAGRAMEIWEADAGAVLEMVGGP